MLSNSVRRELTFDQIHDQLISQYGQPLHDFALNSSLNRLNNAFGSLSNVSGKRILDLGCGAVSGQAEVDANPGTWAPWLARAVVLLGGQAVGLDAGHAPNEHFQFYRVDLRRQNCLDFLEPQSFDGINCSNFFSSPLLRIFQHQSQDQAESLRARLYSDSQKLLKPGGTMIEFDSEYNNL